MNDYDVIVIGGGEEERTWQIPFWSQAQRAASAR